MCFRAYSPQFIPSVVEAWYFRIFCRHRLYFETVGEIGLAGMMLEKVVAYLPAGGQVPDGLLHSDSIGGGEAYDWLVKLEVLKRPSSSL